MTAPSPRPRVALFGLGLMGTGMAGRLLGAGFSLSVFNRTPAKAADLVARGARLARTPRDAAADADILISMLADDAASRDLWLGEHGALGGARTGSVCIECSTVSTAWIGELAAAATQKACDLLDAPVTGSRAQAAAGELNFLVGGQDAVLECAQPVFAAMGRSVVHVGPSGSGALLKLINNFLCGVQAASLAEALVMIERAGLDRDTATAVLAKGAPGSPLLNALLPRMMSKDFAPRFHLGLMQKDLAYAMKEGERVGIPLSTAGAAHGVFERAAASGYANDDFSAVVAPLRDR